MKPIAWSCWNEDMPTAVILYTEPNKYEWQSIKPLYDSSIKVSALENQVDGNHYKELAIQPIQFIHANNIPFMEANVIKYICRHKSKNGLADLEKAKHYIELLMELEYDAKP